MNNYYGILVFSVSRCRDCLIYSICFNTVEPSWPKDRAEMKDFLAKLQFEIVWKVTILFKNYMVLQLYRAFWK